MKLMFLATRRLALVVGLSLLATVSARAQDYYVDAALGSNANGGSSPADAWQTITHALASISSGPPTVHLAPGVYDAALGESFPLVLLSSTTLVGDQGRDVTIIDGGGTPLLIDSSHTSFSRVYGVWLRNATLGIDLEFGWGSEGQMVIHDALISDMQRGISGYVIGVAQDHYAEVYLSLVRTVIRDCTDEGVYLLAESWIGDYDWADARLSMKDSRIEGCGLGFSAVSGWNVESAGMATLERSVVAFNDAGSAADFIVCRWSTVYGNTGRGLQAEAMLVENSIVFGNDEDLSGPTGSSTVAYSDIGDGAAGVGNLSADPLFVDPANGDLRLRFWSPCIDAGDPAQGPTQHDGDLDTVRGLDMGAFEFAPLAVEGTPRIGQTFQLELWGPAGGSALVYLARGLPVDPPLPTPFGELELARQRATLFDIAPTATGPPGLLAVHVPDNLSLVGSTFSMQALSTSSVRNPRQAWTNAVTMTIEP